MVADLLSIITIVLCLIQKLPQIRDLYGYKSARGKLSKTMSLYDFELNYNVSNGVVSFCRRYQCAVTVSRIIQLHIDDDVQLLLRLFDAIVHGISGAVDSGIHSHFVGAEIQTTIEPENVCCCRRLLCHRSTVRLSNSSEIFAGPFGRK